MIGSPICCSPGIVGKAIGERFTEGVARKSGPKMEVDSLPGTVQR
jgi:hypothetical protein